MSVQWFSPSAVDPIPGRTYPCKLICTLESERPTSGIIIGDECYCEDTKKTWTATAISPAVVWEQTGGQSVGNVPTGAIVMWSGLLAAIPSGWVLCDGNNGTPDLRDKFVKGAAAGQNPGGTGGAATHQHTYTEVVQHTHPVSDPGHTHVQDAHTHVQDAHTHVQNAHNHLTQRYPTATGGSSGFTIDTSMSGTLTDNTLPVKDATAVNQNATAVNQNATAVNQNATTGIATQDPAGSVAQGTTAAASSEPAYYAIAFIMKT